MILLPKPPGIHSLIFQLTKTHTQLQKVSVLSNSYWIYCIYQTLQKRIIFFKWQYITDYEKLLTFYTFH